MIVAAASGVMEVIGDCWSVNGLSLSLLRISAVDNVLAGWTLETCVGAADWVAVVSVLSQVDVESAGADVVAIGFI